MSIKVPHINKPLTNVSIANMQDESGFISNKIFPTIIVDKPQGLIYEHDKASGLTSIARKRAGCTETPGGSFGFGTREYRTEVYAVHMDICDQERAANCSSMNLDIAAAQFVAQQMMLKQEMVFAEQALKPGVWGIERPVANAWDTDLGDPFGDLMQCICDLQAKCGKRPNRVVVSFKVWCKLMQSIDFVIRVSGNGQNCAPGMINQEMLASVLGVEEVCVSDALANVGPVMADGSGADLQPIMDDVALVLYTPSTPGLMQASAGYNFVWGGYVGSGSNGMRIKRYRLEHLAATRVEGERSFTYQVMSPDLGCMLTNLCTP